MVAAMRLILGTLLIVLLTACTGRGVILTGGGVRDNTPENARGQVVALITQDLDAQLGPSARSEVVIGGLPRWVPAGRRLSEGWYWDKASVQVDLVGDGGALPTLDKRAVDTVVAKRLRPAVVGGDLLVRVSTLEDHARFARMARAAPAAPATAPQRAPRTAASHPTTSRTYTVQAGDTLADLSTAFYGSAQHWRTIRDANPGSADGALRPGQFLVIPPLP